MYLLRSEAEVPAASRWNLGYRKAPTEESGEQDEVQSDPLCPSLGIPSQSSTDQSCRHNAPATEVGVALTAAFTWHPAMIVSWRSRSREPRRNSPVAPFSLFCTSGIGARPSGSDRR